MAEQYIFSTYKLTKVVGANKREILKDVTISFFPTAKIGVIGHNGAGKSTLLKIMAGLDDNFQGEARLTAGFTVGYLSQEPVLNPEKTVKENVEEGVGRVRDLLIRFEELSMNYSDETADEFARVQDAIEAADGWNLDTRIEMAMEALRCPPGDWSVENLSGGERRRVALCRLLLSAPDLLLLDEPTNHLDAETVGWLENHLKAYHGSVIVVTHDRYFLDNVTDWILELDSGRAYPWSGNYSSWLEQKEERLAKESKSADVHRKTLAHELEWVRLSPKGRQAKSKARLKNYEKLLADEQSIKVDSVEIFIPSGERLGNIVVEAKDLTKAYDDKLLFENFSFELPPAGIVGVIGPNGAGKTTLFRLITGEEQPDEGSLRLGDKVELGYVDQSRDALNADKTVYDEISEGYEFVQLGKKELNSRAYVAKFNFKGGDQQKKVGMLSGGERNRVHMAKLLKRGGNLLLLDEPTNDLDVDTLRALEEGLNNFPGCAMVISHDRWFLNRVATHIMAFEGDSQVVFFQGTYDEYEEDRKKRLGVAADQPHRLKYKPFAKK
ncbi:MAG: energy-dependent translational throttle protein EttA [Candidatus Melainabacteria bacterium HGW-Melainabacteria-1]|nr:MAG: energy-dependent translational throttle protein EttA [Candidatus Melainabacteria bacterium HGW-Melainabacteria-1]